MSSTGGPSLTTQVTSNVLCNGGNTGAANVSISAGTAPFNVLWYPGGMAGTALTNLAAGTYTITVTDGQGCISFDSIAIVEPPVLDAISTSTPTNCPGSANGSVSVAVTGGVSPYGYSWQDSMMQGFG